MPRSVDLRIATIAGLYRQLAYAPPEARRRQMENCERLIEGIDPRRTYPAPFVVFRITGFRMQEVDASELLAGEALIADLSAFVQRLSAGLGLRPDERPGGAETVEQLVTRLGVTVRTAQRWRRLGLVFHEIDFDGAGSDGAPMRSAPTDREPRLGCYRECLERFGRRWPELVRGRRAAARLTAVERAEIVDEARRQRASSPRSLPRSLHSVARTIAARRGRAVETIRKLLVGHDARSAAPIFLERGPLDERDRRFIERAWRRGVALAVIGERLGRSEPAVHRQLSLRRGERLRGLSLRWIELPTFALPDAEAVILGADAARRGLERVREPRDATALLVELAGRTPADDAARDARIGAYNLLKRRAAAAVDSLRGAPRAAEIDAIETSLRWAALIKHVLVADAMPVALRRVEAWAGRAVARLSAEEIRMALALSAEVVSEAIERVDPSREQRLDRLVALDADKALARRASVSRPRAAAAHAAGSVTVADPFVALCPWQRWLDPPSGWAARLGSLDELRRRAITLHHGLGGEFPRTLKQTARALEISPAAASRLVHDAEALMRREASSASPS